jgi:hypothetical protein
MAHLPPGLGIYRCAGQTRLGRPCRGWVVAGFDFCLHHVPDADLEAAEAVVGFKRCRRHFGEPDACRYYATAGTEERPRCRIHGLNTGSVQWKWARMRVRERRLRASAGLPPAPSPERVESALMAVEAEVGLYKIPRRRWAG